MDRAVDEDFLLYLKFLREDVFFTDSRWPQFELLLDDLVELSLSLPPGSRVLSLERNLLYGGKSLFGPIFSAHDYLACDLTPENNANRGSYNSRLLSRIRERLGEAFLDSEGVSRSELEHGMREPFDLVIVPNLLHHAADADDLISLVSQLLAPSGRGYLFDSTLREWHQIPDDFARYTPFGLDGLLRRRGLSVGEIRETGGPFTAALYCLFQASEYISDPSERSRHLEMIEEMRSTFLDLETRYQTNVVRPASRFPTAYSVVFAWSEDS